MFHTSIKVYQPCTCLIKKTILCISFAPATSIHSICFHVFALFIFHFSTRLACTRCTTTWARCRLASSMARLPMIALQTRTRRPHHPAVAVRRAQAKTTHLMSLLTTPFQLPSHPQCIPCLIKELICRKTPVPTILNFSFGMCKVSPIISDPILHF